MRVLELTCEPILHGGQEAFIFNFLDAVSDDSIDIDVATLYYCDNSKYRAIAEKRGAKIFELKLDFKPGHSRRLIIKPLRSFLTKNKYDVIHIHSGSISALAYSAAVARKSGIKNIFVHSHSTGINNLKHKIIQRSFSGIFLKNVTRFLACSKEAGMMKYPQKVNDKTIVLNNGININRFAFDQSIRKMIRTELSIPEDCYVVGQIGRFTFEKNQKFMVEVSLDIPANKKIFFVFIGDGELKEEIQSKCNNKSVIFLDAQDDVWKYYNAFDLLVLPSLYEGIPLVSIEAQANGLPILASTGVSKEIEINNNVFRIGLDDRNLWISTICDRTMERIQEKDNVILKSDWDIQRVTDKLLRLYKSVNRRNL